jgi:UDP-N-acetylmuramoyl-tripeptide--D-alanyl-D-alanine ligase
MRQPGLIKLYQHFLESKEGICTDTRQKVEGSIFFALKGENFDGNGFVEDALSKGCRVAVTEREELAGTPRVLYVIDALKTLQDLAGCHRRERSPKVIAITGSNGKTTTKELMFAVLSAANPVLATRGNLNNHIGVPLTLLSLQQEPIAIVEMGANHPGEIAELARIASPDLGMITNVGKAHLEGFGSLEGVLNAKGELYEYLAQHGGKAMIDGGDQMLLDKAASTGVDTLVVGKGKEIAVSARIIKQTPFLEIELEVAGKVQTLSTQLVGAYNLQNILLGAGMGFQFGIDATIIADSIAGYVPQNQRSQLVKGKNNQLILDSYNANPSSMREAITGLMNYATPPTMLILGDMAELGESSEHEHREMIRWIETLEVDRVLLVGPNFSQVCEPSERFVVFRGRTDLEAYLKDEKPTGYHILVKGSRVMELERLGPLLTH